jgi:hypothetical protein
MNTLTALDLYNVSLEARGYQKVDNWLSIHPSVRQEFEAIAKSVAA